MSTVSAHWYPDIAPLREPTGTYRVKLKSSSPHWADTELVIVHDDGSEQPVIGVVDIQLSITPQHGAVATIMVHAEVDVDVTAQLVGAA